jgi:hypothetical protein
MSCLSRILSLTLCSALATCLGATTAYAHEYMPSSTLFGPLGLNTVPSARMDEAGTVKIGVSALDPYVHAFAGFQLATPLYINIRQTAEASDLNAKAKRLYPGVDLKLRLLEETGRRPEISVGINAALGHKRMASEYIALSKRYNDFDFTAGIGWGRMGSAGHIKNPLKAISKHFGGDRALDGEMANRPAHWFTGDNVGFFAGVEYFTPIDGLSLKFDYGADRYTVEKQNPDFDAPAPWSIGVVYQPYDWVDMSLALQGTDRVMGRISLKGLLQNWRNKNAKIRSNEPKLQPRHTGTIAQQEHTNNEGIEALSVESYLALNPYEPAPRQIGYAAIETANQANTKAEEIVIRPSVMGLQGPSVRLLRRDFERALIDNQGSPQEIWNNAEFDTSGKGAFSRPENTDKSGIFGHNFYLTQLNTLSLSEEDNGVLYRTSAIAGGRGPAFFGFLDAGYALRLNIHDNLDKISDIRPRSPLPVRSDIDVFAQNRLILDHSYLALTHSFTPQLHLSLLGGYLEEMYGGFGGELLYRPFGSRLSYGAELWQVFKRDPYTDFALGLTYDHLLTGHMNMWYEIPHHDLTLQAKAGRYLGEDIGGTLSLHKNFKNGVDLQGFVTVTNKGDFDLFGGTTHAYSGLRLTMPLGGFKYVPKGVSTQLRVEPFGRDTGQALENPLPLYELTRQFSYSHMAQHWLDILPSKAEK